MPNVPSLAVGVVDVDYVLLLNHYLQEVIVDEPYCPTGFNIYLNKLLSTPLDERSKEETELTQEETMLKHILDLVINPERVIELTTTSTATVGRVIHIRDNSYQVPLILQVESLE